MSASVFSFNQENMKLIYITNSRLPSAKAHGHQIVKMCLEFAKQGVEVTLLWPTRKNPIQEDIFSYYQIEPNFIARQIKCFDFIRYDRYLKKISYFLQGLFFLSKLFFLKLDRQAIIYTRKPEIAWLFKHKGYRVVFESHDWFGQSRGLALWLLQKVDGIVATNNYLKQEFIKNSFDSEKILVCPHGVDLNLFARPISREQALDKLGFKAELVGKKILLYTGSFKTMNFSKGLEEILQALKLLNDPSIFFLAVGGSKENIVEYQAMAVSLGLARQASFLSPVNQEALGYYQKAADLLLMPFPDQAHYRYFMTPLKMFEYLAATRPIIASDLPSIKEILSEQVCWFCQPGSANSLAQQIRFVLDHEDEAQSKARSARQLADNFSWPARAKRIINFLHTSR